MSLASAARCVRRTLQAAKYGAQQCRDCGWRRDWPLHCAACIGLRPCTARYESRAAQTAQRLRRASDFARASVRQHDVLDYHTYKAEDAIRAGGLACAQ